MQSRAVCGFGAGLGHAVEVENHPGVFGFAACGDEDELGSPRRFAGSFEVQAGVGLVALRDHFAGLWIDACLAGLGSEQRRDDLAVAVEETTPMGVGERARAVGVQEPDFSCRAGGGLPVQRRRTARGVQGRRGSGCGRRGSDAVASVRVGRCRSGRRGCIFVRVSGRTTTPSGVRARLRPGVPIRRRR